MILFFSFYVFLFDKFENYFRRAAKHSRRLCREATLSISLRNWKDWRRYIS